MAKDYHIFAVPEGMRRDMLSKEQRLFEDIEKRINAPRIITALGAFLSDAALRAAAREKAVPAAFRARVDPAEEFARG